MAVPHRAQKGKRAMTSFLTRYLLPIAAAMMMVGAPAAAQIREIDPNQAIDADLGPPPAEQRTPDNPATPTYNPYDVPPEDNVLMNGQSDPNGNYQPSVPPPPPPPVQGMATPQAPPIGSVPVSGDDTYQQDDLIGAAEGVFGKGAEGLAKVIQDILSKQGEPNGYIVGREGSAAFVVGLRYGSGTLFHKIEGERPVYWTGPSVGFDAGANAGSTFILVYNLYDTEDLYKRYVAGEGAAYLLGGFNVSYLRRGDKVLIPIRVGAGLRLGANVGYMKFSKKQRWLPF
tara:strand:- start:403 stop:1260 length:858 start_codon:yes stop_codon:yes gene_type:complete